MIAPALLARVEQGNDFGGQGVLGMSGAAFELITTAAGKTEIVKGRLAALGLGSNVIHCHRLAGVGLGGAAVGAVAIIVFKKPVAQVCGEITHRYSLSAGGI